MKTKDKIKLFPKLKEIVLISLGVGKNHFHVIYVSTNSGIHLTMRIQILCDSIISLLKSYSLIIYA